MHKNEYKILEKFLFFQTATMLAYDMVTKYGMYPNGCALGIGAGSTRIEAVIQFLNYIMEDSWYAGSSEWFFQQQ